METEERTQEWQEEQLLKHLKRNIHIDEQTHINGKNLQVYYNDTANRHIKQHNTEYFAVQPPLELKKLFKDGLINIRRVQFTIYHDEEEEEEEREEEEKKGDRKYTCFFHCIINWDRFGEEQDHSYWHWNVNYHP